MLLLDHTSKQVFKTALELAQPQIKIFLYKGPIFSIYAYIQNTQTQYKTFELFIRVHPVTILQMIIPNHKLIHFLTQFNIKMIIILEIISFTKSIKLQNYPFFLPSAYNYSSCSSQLKNIFSPTSLSNVFINLLKTYFLCSSTLFFCLPFIFF